MNPETKTCKSCQKHFTIDPDDFGFYEQMKVPPPTLCPRCRMIRRMGWHGQRVLYKRKCNYSGENVITFYHPDSPHKLYRQDIWWSDAWDPKSYGRDYDPTRSFFEQWGELFRAVPHPALYAEHATLENSEYTNGVAYLKNCYLVFSAAMCKDCAYLRAANDSKETYDGNFIYDLELCHDVLMVDKSYQVFSSRYCRECQNVLFSSDCVGCTDCIGCINLRNKKYHVFNQSVGREEYERVVHELDLGSHQKREAFRKKAGRTRVKPRNLPCSSSAGIV